MYTIDQLTNIVQAQILQKAGSGTIAHLAMDSRKISFAGETLFFALSAAFRDGHDFIVQAYKKGVRNFIVEKPIPLDSLPEATILQVPDSLLALQQIAAYHRKQFHFPVIGITGSNGKTIVKEWLFQLLHHDFNIVRSPKSYNSQIGVPLSVWNIQQANNFGIFEAGISTTGEMPNLEKIISPTIGILTNIGNAHSEGFESETAKLKEKMQLFTNAGVLIHSTHPTWVKEIISHSPIPKMSWGFDAEADLQILSLEKTDQQTRVSLSYRNETEELVLPFYDDASIENSLCCICTLLYLNYSFKKIKLLLPTLEPVAMRLEQKRGIHNCILINDSYSNDFTSLQIALDYLQQQNPALQKTVILTDFPGGYNQKSDLYHSVAALLAQKQVKKLIGIGNDLMFYRSFFSGIANTVFYTDTESAIQGFQSNDFNHEAILLKGARVFHVEKIAALLEEKVHQTVLEINLHTVVENVKKHQQLLAPSTRIMAIVKAFGYGSGATEVALLLQNLNIAYLAVAYADEGVLLRKAGIHLPIMVMNTDEAAFPALIDYDLEPEIFSISLLQKFLVFATKNTLINYPVHLKLDTGMHRLGFEETDLKEVANLLKSNNLIEIKTVFSHLVGSEDPDLDSFTTYQNELFLHLCSILEKELGYGFIRHIANSAAVERHPGLQHQMVRLGIGMYGVTDNKTLHLQQVATLKTTIAQIKTVAAGESVGYNRKGKVLRPSKIATVRLGYADGYNRRLGNGNGKMLLNGKLAPTIGNICMDMTMLDVTDIADVQADDEVIVFGPQLPVMELAKWCNTIPYEILTGISQRVKRIFFGE